MKEMRTYWADKEATWPSFDDYIVLSVIHKERIFIRPNEFQFLIDQLFENWKAGKSHYIQLLKEWNECTGFQDVDETPSLLLDITETLYAFKLLKGVEEPDFGKITSFDLQRIIDFINRNHKNDIMIWKDY